jgi:hypothetical protein
MNHKSSWLNIKPLDNFTQCQGHNIHLCSLLPFQVDANAIFVDYSNISYNVDYLQSVSDIRVAARYVTK